MTDDRLSVIINGVTYIPAAEVKVELQPQINQADRRLYLLLDELRSAINKYRNDMSGPRLQNDIDDLDRMAWMANRAIGILISPMVKS